MGQLVKISDREAQYFGQGWRLTPEDVVLIVCDAAYVFHGAKIVLWHEYLVVFAEGIGFAEKALVESHTCLCHVEHLFMIDLTDKGLSRIDPHEGHTLGLTLMIAEWTSDDRIQVGRDAERLIEVDELRVAWLSLCELSKRIACF